MDYVIIVAGGKGLRMGSDIPKQFLPIGGKPVLMRTLERFRQYSPTLQIILVLPTAQQDYWLRLCKEYDFQVEYQLADGGETRFHSVQNGLAKIPDNAEGVVGVHDPQLLRNRPHGQSRHPRHSHSGNRPSPARRELYHRPPQ